MVCSACIRMKLKLVYGLRGQRPPTGSWWTVSPPNINTRGGSALEVPSAHFGQTPDETVTKSSPLIYSHGFNTLCKTAELLCVSQTAFLCTVDMKPPTFSLKHPLSHADPQPCLSDRTITVRGSQDLDASGDPACLDPVIKNIGNTT